MLKQGAGPDLGAIGFDPPLGHVTHSANSERAPGRERPGQVPALQRRGAPALLGRARRDAARAFRLSARAFGAWSSVFGPRKGGPRLKGNHPFPCRTLRADPDVSGLKNDGLVWCFGFRV